MMMMRTERSGVLPKAVVPWVLMLLLSAGAVAQSTDVQSWVSAGITTDIGKRFSAGFQTQVRVMDRFSQVGSVLLEPEVAFKVNKYLKFGLGYRFTIRTGIDDFNRTANRFNIDAEGRKKFGDLAIKLRARLQQGFPDPYLNENREPYSYPLYTREKLSFAYRVSKLWSPFIEAELFFPLNDARKPAMDRYRVTVGSSFDLKYRNAVEVFFRLQQEVSTPDPETDLIIGIGYTYDLKLPKFKKKKDKKDGKGQ
ncbi:MAG: DUF2490 domain-containing protein [Flavobacteriales bacterium]|nr:DUF2490 domain-containing protein [Flavobacteriales bacterium]